MAVKKRGRREIIVNDETYIWHVALNRDGPGKVLHVANQDKTLVVMHALEKINEEDSAYVVVVCAEGFEGAEKQGFWQRFVSPEFHNGLAVMPSHVRNLILWCRSAEHERTPYDFCGCPVL